MHAELAKIGNFDVGQANRGTIVFLHEMAGSAVAWEPQII